MANHTGHKCPQSGIWRPSNGGTPIAVSKGDTFPPSGGDGVDWILVQPTT